MIKFIFLQCLTLVLLGIFYGFSIADTDDFNKYKDYEVISQSMLAIKAKNPNFVKLFDIGTTDPVMPGTSPETIKAILISANAGNAADPNYTTGKPAVIITGAIHANEWIGAEVALALADYLVSNATSTVPLFGSKTMTIKKLLENVEVVVVPVLNPAGYRYSRNEHRRAAGCTVCSPYNEDQDLTISRETITDDYGTIDSVIGYDWYREHDIPRYADWRKNRRDVSNDPGGPGETGKFFGVDLNRNFPAYWNPVNSGSSDPRHYSVYRGNAAGSEKETQALMIRLYQSRKTKAAIDYHSSRTMKIIAYPWAHTNDTIPETNENLRPYSKTKDKDLFPAMANRMKDIIQGGYTVGQNQDYIASGTVRDWAYDTQAVAAFNFEVTTPTDGYQPNWERIAPISEENKMGAVWLMFWAADQGFRSKPKLQLGNY